MATIGTKEAAEYLGLKQVTLAKICREGKIMERSKILKEARGIYPNLLLKRC